MKRFTKIMAAVLAAAAITVSAGTINVSATAHQAAKDSQFLNDMGLCPDRWGECYARFHWDEVSQWDDGCWAKVGVCCVSHYWYSNDYYIDGKEVTRYEALEYAAKKLGKSYEWKKYADRTKKSHRKKGG